jgi:hypothetical protein
MTLRDYLQRRCRRTVTGTVVFLIVLGLSFGAVPWIFILRFILAVLAGAVVLAAFLSQFQIPCPNCKRSLGRIGFMVGTGGYSGSSPHCPHCDISVDAPLPAATESK